MAISVKCSRAYSVLQDDGLVSRVRACESVSEYGFALLLQFVRIEASLKVLRYWQNTKDGWPDRLDFLQANWAPLRDLKALNTKNYDFLIGVGGRSLLEMRNRIAHEGYWFNKDEYLSFAEVAVWALAMLKCRLPPKSEVAAKVERLRKRRVNARDLA